MSIRFEHIAINVTDAPKVVEWYVKNLDLVVVRSTNEPPYMTFVSDQGRNMMFEFYQQPVGVADYASLHPVTFHIAFAVDDIEATRSRLIAAGATPEGEITTTAAGDRLCFLRDPWGVTLQLVMRARPMLS
ncbi:MAG: VOC family protein [Thermoflexales bacterium]|nr:VOC family protein [Thermoflexales bacterium]MDW8351733.1 VOC family protein [Anaerolineae bacterium]